MTPPTDGELNALHAGESPRRQGELTSRWHAAKAVSRAAGGTAVRGGAPVSPVRGGRRFQKVPCLQRCSGCSGSVAPAGLRNSSKINVVAAVADVAPVRGARTRQSAAIRPLHQRVIAPKTRMISAVA